MTRIDVAIVGAGMTGLASALALATHRLSVCVLERHGRAGLDTSTHNSGVIHAGMYYPAGSLKARLCVEGRRLLYQFCAAHQVPHRKCGKLIVAHDAEELATLHMLLARGRANGVDGLALVGRDFIVDHEPAVHAPHALWSPETGIVDAAALVTSLLAASQRAGAIFLPDSPLVAAVRQADGMLLDTPRERIHARTVVNAAGLWADETSRILEGEAITIFPCRGEYAQLTRAKRSMVNGLVYPLPPQHSLGVHLVKTIAGDVWIGPTASFQTAKDDYESHRLPVEAFLEPAQRLLRDITLEDLRLGGSGIRPKIHPPEESFADFLIRRDRRNPFVVQASGIESPGLTACLAIGRLIAELVAKDTAQSDAPRDD